MIGDDQLLADVRRETRSLLESAGIDPSLVRCRSDRHGSRVVIRLDTDVAISPSLRQALGVRVLDAVRSGSGETVGAVVVEIGPDSREAPSVRDL